MTTRLALVVCTANVCRSPVAERALRRRLGGLRDVDGASWRVVSAGTAEVRAEVDKATRAAAVEVGLDVDDHIRRRVDRQLLQTEPPDLVLTMTRQHLRTVVGLDPTFWPRTFTVKELARRARELSARHPPSVQVWLADVHRGRRSSDLIRPDENDDVADPYGGTRDDYRRMIDEVVRAVDELVAFGPWRTAV